MKFTYKSLLALAGMAVYHPGFSQKLDLKEIQTHVRFLASDSLEGRGTGTLGEIRAANYIASSFLQAGLEPKGYEGSFFQPFGVTISVESIPHQVTARNVVGFLDNQAEKTIVIGAHFDHLGKGYQSGSLSPDSREMIHNGADDNASGTAGLIELARYYATNNIKEGFNFLFVAFSGEELGLLGSKFFVSKSEIPVESMAFMINMDMIGRLDEEKGLTIGGWGTSPSWGDLLPGIARNSNLKYNVDSSGIGPSDHTSFYLKEKPVLFFFTGVHSDYHKPSDDADKINARGILTVLQTIVGLVDELDAKKIVPSFTTAGNPHAQATQQTFKVTLGVIPDYSFTGKGLKIDGVTKDRPADLAGMKAGDIVLKMGELTIANIQDYMKALGTFEKGQTTNVEINRQDEKKVLRVMF
ncbi:M28 family peptidase [Arundinibacter roseus]|uniref:M28 family peptidase n=1 Tax=Arundinibacter roseus TaxID=2070510 RepID=A0A4R4KCV1_9BACT|nr:M28 family peptidase [Arundinibacter roseus]TDB64576.1 M28 family peptidase [Arundinibacter roseus]